MAKKATPIVKAELPSARGLTAEFRARDDPMRVEGEGLHYGKLTQSCIHICVDMQRMFLEDTDWKAPWMQRILPIVTRMVASHPAQTVFTRFVPVDRPGEGWGTLRRFYERWP